MGREVRTAGLCVVNDQAASFARTAPLACALSPAFREISYRVAGFHGSEGEKVSVCVPLQRQEPGVCGVIASGHLSPKSWAFASGTTGWLKVMETAHLPSPQLSRNWPEGVWLTGERGESWLWADAAQSDISAAKNIFFMMLRVLPWYGEPRR